MSQLRPTAPRPLLETIFLSPDEKRLRAGWRLAIQTALMILLVFGAGLVIITASFILSSDPDLLVISQAAELVAITGSVFLARRFLDRRSIASLGLRLNAAALADLCAGILITFVLMGGIFLAFLAAGWTQVEGFAWQTAPADQIAGGVFGALLLFILVGWNEELLSRGYHLQTIAGGLTLPWGVIVSSAVFGVLHLSNPGATWISTAGIFLAGVFLAYGYLSTRQLWLPIGLHIGWNFFEGTVFGFPVSGLEVFSLLRHRVTGPDLWTGGLFGPEAGLIVLPALAVGALLINLYSRRLRPAAD